MDSMIPQMLITLIMYSLMMTMKFNKKKNSMTITPFECGFSKFPKPMSMSIQFSLVAFIFLIFDIELTIIISANTSINPTPQWFMTMLVFLITMMISVAYEMSKNSLQWTT